MCNFMQFESIIIILSPFSCEPLISSFHQLDCVWNNTNTLDMKDRIVKLYLADRGILNCKSGLSNQKYS